MISKLLIVVVIVITTLTIMNLGSDSVFAQEDQKFVAVLSPMEGVPPVNSQATGIAEFTVVGDTIKYTVNASDIQGATSAHIHLGAKGTNGIDLATLFDNNSPRDKVAESGELTRESGLFEYVTDLTTPMMDGELYVDVHSTQNPDGELRGQITEENL